MLITLRDLESLRVCEDARERFERLFGDSAVISEENAEKAIQEFGVRHVVTLVEDLLLEVSEEAAKAFTQRIKKEDKNRTWEEDALNMSLVHRVWYLAVSEPNDSDLGRLVREACLEYDRRWKEVQARHRQRIACVIVQYLQEHWVDIVKAQEREAVK
jgi:hypothetical protein